jgi:hypothetical protein
VVKTKGPSLEEILSGIEDLETLLTTYESASSTTFSKASSKIG